MRIIDADILAYALVENHVASTYSKKVLEKGVSGELELYVTYTTLLETYNTLYWYYRVRPREKVALKIKLVAEGLRLVEPSPTGFEIALKENVPLGDALLVATALEHRIPVIVSNDRHIERLTRKYGLIYENPIPPEIRRKMGGV